ncbi:unnamed protein product [Leptosia nina]|uniref:E3 ubiquitin-protein ligase n=1 Tax=Leptosia nina TaxID=320188 RepID=A0AAV1IWQ1_9NEOP
MQFESEAITATAAINQEQNSPSVNSNSQTTAATSNYSLYPNLPAAATRANVMQPMGGFTVHPTAPTAPPFVTFSAYETQKGDYFDGKFNERRSMNTKCVESLQRCPNCLDGCQVRAVKSKLPEHLKECLYNDLSCPVNAVQQCSWKGKINQLTPHFEEKHPECLEILVNRESILHIGHSYQFTNLVNVGSNKFLLHLIVRKDQKTITFAVQHFGTEKNANKWTHELRVYDKSEPRRLFSYVNSCQSHNDSLNGLIKRREVGIADLDYLKTFAKEDTITYKLLITNASYKDQNQTRGKHQRREQNSISYTSRS